MGEKSIGPNKEPPNSRQANPPQRANERGFYGEQLSFFPTPEFCPLLPKHGSQAAEALAELVVRDITQLDWLKPDKPLKWRLSSPINELKNLGWEPQSILVDRGRKRRIALYSLHQKAKAAYFTLTKGGDAEGK